MAIIMPNLKKKVLLVEDEVVMAKMYQERFQKAGFDVEIALTAEEGLKKAKKEKPDLVVLDILLPRADGIEFLRKLRADKDLKNIRVVALSNYDVPETKKRARGLGVKAYLMKADYIPRTLVQEIKKHMPA